MIAKINSGSGFRGALDYVARSDKAQDVQSKSRLIGTNMSGTSMRELAKEFGEVRQLKPRVNKAVHHVSLSAAAGEMLTNEQWRGVAHEYLEGMGFANNQYVIHRHSDTKIDHVHVIANRISYDGRVISDSNERRKANRVTASIEQKYNLHQTNHGRAVNNKITEKRGRDNDYVHSLANKIDSVLQNMNRTNSTFTPDSFAKELAKSGIHVKFNKSNEGSIRGASFKLNNGQLISGGKIRRDLTFNSIKKRFQSSKISGLKFTRMTLDQKQKLTENLENSGYQVTPEKWGMRLQNGNYQSFIFDNGNVLKTSGFFSEKDTANALIQAAQAKDWTAISIDRNTDAGIAEELREQATGAGITVLDQTQAHGHGHGIENTGKGR